MQNNLNLDFMYSVSSCNIKIYTILINSVRHIMKMTISRSEFAKAVPVSALAPLSEMCKTTDVLGVVLQNFGQHIL